MAYYESEPSGGAFNNANNQSTEKSIKSCYAVVYELDNRKWVVAGEGGWSEVHLCEDSLDNSYRILAWTVKSQQVLMNCNVTAECTYKEKSKNFHSFSDENGNRYGLGFHKSESGLKQAAHFLKSVISVITQCKEDLNPSPPQAPDLPYQQPQSSPNKMANSSTPQHPSSTPSGPSPSPQNHQPGGMPPPNPYQSKPQQSSQQQNSQNQYGVPPPMFSQMDTQQNNQPQHSQNNGYKPQQQQNNAYNNNNSYQQQQQQQQKSPYHPPPAQLQQSTTSASYNHANHNNNNNNNNVSHSKYAIDVSNNNHINPQTSGSPSISTTSPQQIYASRSASPGPAHTPKLNGLQPTYHLKTEQHNAIPKIPVGPLGNLKILPPKPQKHYSGDKKIKNPTAVEHKVRVTHDKDTGVYSGLPAEWLEHLNKQFGVHPKQLPGVQLELYHSKIPKVLITLRGALEEANAYQQVGIFRLAPNASDNKAMKEKINKGQLENEEKVDVNVYANLIKVWFRDLPDPLLNAVNPDLIEHVQSQDDAANVIENFPEPNKSIFLWLCDMCCDIAQYEKINKMGAENMAIVVAPNLFNTDKFENPMKAMTYSQKVVEFFKHSILWRQKGRGY